MTHEQVDKRNYDVASISRPGKAKRSNYVQDALHIESSKVQSTGQFIKVFANMFLRREASKASYF
jgi:hypothetical protein